MQRANMALRSRQCGYVAAGWAVLFAALHFFWALGGSTGLASSAGRQLAEQRPIWFVAGGLWGVGILLILSAALALALARSRFRGRLRRLASIAGTALALLLLARGLGIEILLLTGAFDGNAEISAAQVSWTLMLWNPWFVIGGIAFALASRYGCDGATRRQSSGAQGAAAGEPRR